MSDEGAPRPRLRDVDGNGWDDHGGLGGWVGGGWGGAVWELGEREPSRPDVCGWEGGRAGRDGAQGGAHGARAPAPAHGRLTSCTSVAARREKYCS